MYRQNLVKIDTKQTENHLQQNVQLSNVCPILTSSNSSTSAAPVVLDSAAAMALSMGTSMYHERALMARNDIWHRILIHHGARYDKENVLKSILKTVYPADLVPVKYQVVGDDACFLVRNCDRGLNQLCKVGLIINVTDECSLILSITLAFASIHQLKINIQPLLLTILNKRYNAEKKALILDNFHKDPDIYKTVYCPLSLNRVMIHVLKLAKNALGSFEYLSLQNNELSSLSLETSNIKSVKYIDLRYNSLLQVQSLEPLKTLNISEIWLDGNPLCENYFTANQYVESVRQYCPNMYKLDGVQVNEAGLPIVFKSYEKNLKRRNLVEQFVEHFFSAYDCKDRMVLKGLYHKEAWYSTTVSTPTSPASKKFLEPFSHENRNVLIFGKNSHQLLYHGSDQILKVLKKLPLSQHFYKSFCCDLMYDADDIVTISVEGLFKLVNATDQIFSFNRTFILTAKEENEFTIINDQYHVYLPVHGIDYITYNIENDYVPLFEPTCFSHGEKQNLTLTLQELSTMELESCEKYLTDANWDIKRAIFNFLSHYKNGQLPKNAFIKGN